MLNSLRKSFSIALLLAGLFVTARAQTATDGAAQLLPEMIGEFRAEGVAVEPDLSAGDLQLENFDVLSSAARRYQSTAGPKYFVTVFHTRSNSAAYALLTSEVKSGANAVGVERVELGGAQVVGAVARDSLTFIKGAICVRVNSSAPHTVQEKQPTSDDLVRIARSVAERIEAPPGEIPPLVQHLPDWERSQGQAFYAVTLPALKKAVGAKPALDAVSFDGRAEAVTATYDGAQLVIIEYTTPQYAAEADARINERIKQLRDGHQPAPSAYQRIGNYSVFVFDTPDEQRASELVSSVKYEKEVRWLGDNPHAAERAAQQYTNTMGNVIFTSLKATGAAIILCLGVGGLFGGAVFLYRRAHTAEELYSDAGGMMRLNLEEASGAADTAGAIGEQKH